MKKLSLLLTLLCSSAFLFAQISQYSTPPSFEVSNKKLNKLEVETLASPNIDDLLNQAEKNGTFYAIGKQIPVNYHLFNSGEWQTLPDGSRIWRLKIQADDNAKALNPYFDEFYLPQGCRLFVYNEDKTAVLGAFTHHNNHASGVFAIGHLPDDNMILEYHEAADIGDEARLSISHIGYTFRGVKSLKDPDDFGDSGDCEININCSPEGDDWQDEKNASVRILVVAGGFSGWCSGSMVNNVRQDCMPYMLTAMHCGLDFFGGGFASEAELNQWVFYYNYESPTCENPASEGTLASQSVTGASLVSDSGDGGGDSGSDFALLQLNSAPPEDYNAYYLGWSNEDVTSNAGTTIHHPQGDIMKISAYSTPLISTSWLVGTGLNSHWEVVWSPTASGFGVTEGGSSGCPIFNNDGELIGTLTGGSAFCFNPTSPDQYGKFAYHWTSNGTEPERQLAPWLDPDGTGATTLTGTYAPCEDDPPPPDDCNGQPAPEVVVQAQTGGCSANSGSLTATASGGAAPYTYTWSNGETSSGIGGLPTGTYSITVTDANGCETIANQTLSSAGSGPELSLSTLPQTMIVTSCHGSEDAFIEVIITNGEEPFTYQWSNGATSEGLSDVGPGIYTLVVTDANGCAAVITAEVFEPDELELIPTSLPSSGDDGVAAVNVAGGTPPYDYQWSNGDSTQIANGLPVGNYSVTVTDDSGCMISGNVTVDMFTNTLNLDNLAQFYLSPNPSNGQFIVDTRFDAYQEFDIFVFNSLGQAVTQIHTGGEMLTVPIDIRGQNKGTYFVVIQTSKGQAVRKLILNK